MPVEFKFLNHGMGILLEGKGSLTGQELIAALTEIYRSEENYKKVKYSITDFTHVESLDISIAEIEVMAQMHRIVAKTTPYRVVVMAVSKDLAFGLSRVWQANVDEIKWDTTIVRSRSEAESLDKEKVKNKFDIDITME